MNDKYYVEVYNNYYYCLPYKRRDSAIEINKDEYTFWEKNKTNKNLKFDVINRHFYIEESAQNLDVLKQIKLKEILLSFTQWLKNGHYSFTLESGQIVTVDGRRFGKDNDLQNVEGILTLIEKINSGEITIHPNTIVVTNGVVQGVYYKCYDNSVYFFTVNDMKNLYNYLLFKGIKIYELKHYYESLVSSATTKEELDAIIINWEL